MPRVLGRGLIASVAMLPVLAACSYQLGYKPEYLPAESAPFIAHGKILVVLPKDQSDFVYKGGPASSVGDYTTMTIPIGRIVRDISNEVFTSCFADGVEFADERSEGKDYVIAVEPNLKSFLYRYAQVIDTGFSEEDPDRWIIPEVEVTLNVSAYNANGELLLRHRYESGIAAGKEYRTASRPAERINETLHATLHHLFVQIATDLRPLLIGTCKVEDLAPSS